MAKSISHKNLVKASLRNSKAEKQSIPQNYNREGNNNPKNY